MTRNLCVSLLLVSLCGPSLGQPTEELLWTGPLANQQNPQIQTLYTVEETPWLAFMEEAGVVYFVFQQPPRVERYAIETQEWLPPIPLADIPTAFFVDGDGFYLSFGRRTSRFSLDWQVETHLRNTNYDVTDLVSSGDFVYLNAGSEILSADKWVGTLLDWQDYFYRLRGLSIAPDLGKLYGRSSGVSPADIVEVTLNPDGTFGGQSDSPYHGDYPGASQTYTFPSQSYVADNSGIVYHALDLTYANSLAGAFQDLSFYGDLPIVLRDGTLYSYSTSFLRTGQYDPATPPLGIQVYEDLILAFSYEQNLVQVENVPISYLTTEPPGLTVDPRGLEYQPDEVVVGADNTVYLLSRGNLSIFRWSIEDYAYLESIPLTLAPTFMALSVENDALYLAYSSGEITRILLSSAERFLEEPFVNSPQTPCGLATAGEFLFVCDPSGAWVSHFTYDSSGALISQEEWNYFSQEFVWSPANRKMYHLRDSTSPNDLLWEEIDESGVIGVQMDSPYHSSNGIRHPIRVSTDGSLVVLGSGRLYDGTSLVQIDTLSNDVDDAVWAEGELFTLREYGAWSQIQKWDQPNWGIGEVRELEGAPVRIFSWRDELLAITIRDGKPWFSRWSLDLEGQGLSISKTDGLDLIESGQWIEYSIVVANLGTESVLNVSVSDQFPKELTEISWTCAASPGSVCGSGSGDIADLGFIHPQGVLHYVARARVLIQAGSLLINHASASHSGVVYSETDLTQVERSPTFIFFDGFESGDTSAWNGVISGH